VEGQECFDGRWRHNCHVSGVVRWANDKEKRCLCDLERESLMLGARVGDLECIRYAGTQDRGEREDANSINKERKRNETRDANKRDYLNARRGWK
jgi:hypothetical protein